MCLYSHCTLLSLSNEVYACVCTVIAYFYHYLMKRMRVYVHNHCTLLSLSNEVCVCTQSLHTYHCLPLYCQGHELILSNPRGNSTSGLHFSFPQLPIYTAFSSSWNALAWYTHMLKFCTSNQPYGHGGSTSCLVICHMGLKPRQGLIN